jgi:hypothetical protein
MHWFMKFRCISNSIRFRVRKSDLEMLQARGFVEEAVHFASGACFRFRLEWSQAPVLEASFEEGCISVLLPGEQAREWIASEAVAIEQHIGELQILIEKDFPCRHTSESNREDTFHELAPEDPSLC